MDENKMKNLEAMKEFFERDMKIKETLMSLAPTEADDYDELSRMEYVDKLEKGLDSLEYDTLASIKKFGFGEELNNTIREYFANKKKSMAVGKYEAGICQKIYNSEFASMSENFIEEVKEGFVGYAFFSNPSKLPGFVKKAKTVNELLHSIHSSIVNNDEILESMPQMGTKRNTIEEPITLYGEENEVAEKIFKEFPLEMDCGITDIVSLKNKVLMMIRDRGHALTIDMDTTNPKEVEVKYFVPKLCNEEMIRKLPGINESSITKSGASGFFVSDKDKITKDLFDFIEKVPTDGDMVFDKTIYEINEKPLSLESDKNVDEEKTSNIESENNKEENIFSMEDAKELAMQPGSEGRRFSKINEIKNKIIIAFKNLKEKLFDKDR
ncbi:MAG: hypothetical protein V8R39_00300 [Clostridia bacterium]